MSGHATLSKFLAFSLAAIAWTVWADLGVAGEAKVSPGPPNDVVAGINGLIRQGWQDNGVKPSPVAEDSEWLRRVSLDLGGRIPTASEVEVFSADKNPSKRQRMVESLLERPDRVKNFAELWSNLLIGRNPPPRTNRTEMRKFLQDGFESNRPWNDIVYDLLTAEGHFEQQGAVNFLLAQLEGNPNTEDYHVQATAKASRLFLGLQVQCTQCHNHPFNDWKQNQFWEFNSFFRQARRIDHRKTDPNTGQMVDDYSELVFQKFSGPVYFEMRNGLMQVAYPNYLGTMGDPKSDHRRDELARLICRGDSECRLARAMVNRMWGHFFGYGFTRPVDDIGPHSPPSHPELLELLTQKFLGSGYDLKQLSRWICDCEAYGLTSQTNSKNEVDNPANGEVPLFSHLYVKSLRAEQLYDSLMIATTPPRTSGGGINLSDEQREKWLQEFMHVFGESEDDEPTRFSSSIPQALLMMNGPVVRTAISQEEGSFLNAVVSNPRNQAETRKVEVLYLSALGRNPTRAERSQLGQLLSKSGSEFWAYQDLYWALLNSNEFVVNH